MATSSITRRRALVGLASAVAPVLWLPACRGDSGVPFSRAQPGAPTPPPAVPSQGSEAPILQRIVARATTDGQGATLERVFPGPQLANLDPFVLLDDFDVREPAGFPEHPHRGFEAFTYMIDGAFHHRDDLGNDSTITGGGTQRFTSGRGARHSEMPATKGSNRGLQLWVNLPRELKTMEPEYAGVAADGMPVDERDGQRIHTIVGDGSPVRLRTNVEYLDVTLLADGGFSRVIPGDRSSLLYVLEGSVSVGRETVPRGTALLLGEGELWVAGKEGARFAWLSGQPHHQPIVHRGPFVD